MAESRRHRLEIPAVPSTDDPAQLKKYIAKLRQLTMDEFNRMATDLFNFKAEVANSVGYTLQAVSNINVISTSYGATFSWVLPQQTEVTPTHVRVRIAEFGDAWAEFSYPLTSWSTSGLLPGLEYTFQVQLVYRGEVNLSYVSSVRNCPSVPTLVESTSEIRSRSFTTASGIGPPADGGGGNTNFPIPDVDGTPGTGGAGTGCHWEWKIQIADADDGTWSDTVHNGTVDGDAGVITLDTTITGLNLLSTRVYRLCIREVCDAVPIGDGSYQCGEPFIGDNDWLDGCGGAPVNASASESPYDSADLFAIPLGCLPTAEGLLITDAISDLEVIRGDDLQTLLYSNDEWTLLAKDLTGNSGYWGQLGWALLPLISGLNNADDITFALSYKVDTLFPSGGAVVVDPILGVALRVTISLRSDGTNYGFQVTAQRESGGSLILQSPLELTVDGEYHEVFFVSDADGNKTLYVDGEEKAQDTSGQEIRWDNNEGNVRLYGHTEARLNKVYAWNRALDESEIVTISASSISGQIEEQSSGPWTYEITAPDDSSLVVSGTHKRSGGTSISGEPTLTGVSAWTTLHASDRYDTDGASDGSAAFFRSLATSAGTLSSPGVSHQEIAMSFAAGTSVIQSATAKSQVTDAVSVSLSSPPSGSVFVMLFSGGQQTPITPPADPSGWVNLFYQEKIGNGTYYERGWVYQGEAQTFTMDLPAGAITNGGWIAMIFEVA